MSTKADVGRLTVGPSSNNADEFLNYIKRGPFTSSGTNMQLDPKVFRQLQQGYIVETGKRTINIPKAEGDEIINSGLTQHLNDKVFKEPVVVTGVWFNSSTGTWAVEYRTAMEVLGDKK